MNRLTKSQITDLLKPYGVDASPALAAKTAEYIELLLKWNRKIALTTVTDPVEVVKFHFGESLFVFSTGACGKSRLADVGPGAGFPGLALAIADPSLQITLIESNLKKCAFLSEVVRKIEVANATVIAKRMESVDATLTGFDFVSARAFGQFVDLLRWSKQSLEPDGRVLLWLGEDDVRTLASQPGWFWDVPVLIPGSTRRFILKGRPYR